MEPITKNDQAPTVEEIILNLIDDGRQASAHELLQAVETAARLRRSGPRIDLPPEKELFTKRELIAALGGKKPAKLSHILARENLVATGNGKARRYPRTTVEFLQKHYGRGIGQSTSNGYMTAVKAFAKWLFTNGRAARHHLVDLNPRTVTDLRHERRALRAEELRTVIRITGMSATTFMDLSGRDRQGIYLVAILTGYRASEIASMTPARFDLAAAVPVLRVMAKDTKNDERGEQPLPAEIAAWFRNYLDGQPTGSPLWPGAWNKHAAAMLRQDLKAARIPYRDNEDRVCDFHALRHSYITLLSISGIHVKLVQDLARHSDIRQTMGYTHTHLHDLAGAVERLPLLLTDDEPARQALAATGTHGNLSVHEVQQDPSDGQVATPRHGTSENEGINFLRISCTMGENEVKKGVVIEKTTLPELRPSESKNTAENTGFSAISAELPGQDSNLDKESQNRSFENLLALKSNTTHT